MNTNEMNNREMNVEEYENMAVENSNRAKKIAAGIAAAAVGGAAVSGGAVYAADHVGEDGLAEGEITSNDVMGGAAAADAEPAAAKTATETRSVQHSESRTEVKHEVIEEPAPAEEKVALVEENSTVSPEGNEEPEPDVYDSEVTWDETTNLYIDGERVASLEEGSFEGHKLAIADIDGDDRADYLAIDVNDNDVYDADETVALSQSDNIFMGNATAHTTDQFYTTEPVYAEEDFIEDKEGLVAENEANTEDQQEVQDDFEEEKAGDDYAEEYAQNEGYEEAGAADDVILA